jgi:HEAT repeat protein
MSMNLSVDAATLATALGAVSKSLKALSFYPAGHPARAESLEFACNSFAPLLAGGDIQLKVGRNSFTTDAGQQITDSGPVAALAFELFARQCSVITVLSDLYQDDLLDLLRVLSVPPETIQQQGGLERMLAGHGVRTIWVNELNLTAIEEMRCTIESADIRPEGLELSVMTGNEQPQQMDEAEVLPLDQQLQLLVDELTETADQEAYAAVVGRGLEYAAKLKKQAVYEPLLAFAGRLMVDREDPELGKPAGEGFVAVASGQEFLAAMFERLLGASARERRVIEALLRAGGADMAPLLVEHLGASDSKTRRDAQIQLSALGSCAVPALREAMWDGRPELTRGIVAVMGGLGEPALVDDLKECLFNADSKIAKEAVRSLARIGGAEAEDALIRLLQEAGSELLPQTMVSLGAMRSIRALPLLEKILAERDLLLSDTAIKQAAIEAMATIGEKGAVPALWDILDRRPLLAREKWEQLQLSAAQAIGRIGDMTVLPALEKKAGRQDAVGRACSEAVIAIQRREAV